MTVYDLADLYIEGHEDMKIYDLNTEETVFEGDFEGAKDSKYADCEVASFGIEGGVLVFNIDTEY